MVVAWLRNLFGTKPGNSQRDRRIRPVRKTIKPCLEPLEDRTVPSVTFQQVNAISGSYSPSDSWSVLPGLTTTVSLTTTETVDISGSVNIGGSGFIFYNVALAIFVDGTQETAPQFDQISSGTYTSASLDQVVTVGPGNHLVSVEWNSNGFDSYSDYVTNASSLIVTEYTPLPPNGGPAVTVSPPIGNGYSYTSSTSFTPVPYLMNHFVLSTANVVVYSMRSVRRPECQVGVRHEW